MDFNGSVNRDIIEDISETCPPGKYCILKEIVLRSGINDRLLVQLKCIEKFKYERSYYLGRDIGWEEAHKAWVSEGFSERFSRCYSEGMSFRQVYPLVTEKL